MRYGENRYSKRYDSSGWCFWVKKKPRVWAPRQKNTAKKYKKTLITRASQPCVLIIQLKDQTKQPVCTIILTIVEAISGLRFFS